EEKKEEKNRRNRMSQRKRDRERASEKIFLQFLGFFLRDAIKGKPAGFLAWKNQIGFGALVRAHN
ncbi:MAG: hypothetical protein Q8P67_28380, partial [archaeon]|nr:hypothetical protein [archaeon]